MKVHITLVGGQPAPVYHGIVATKPDVIVFIYSNQSVHVLDSLKKEIDTTIDEQEPLDPTNPLIIRKRAESLAKKYVYDDITVNISSGLKSWSHIFGVVFDRLPNASVVYMDQNNVLWNYRTMQSQDDFSFDMHTLFRLYGNSLDNNYKKFSDYTQADFEMISRIERTRRYNNRDFNKLTTVLSKEDCAKVKTQEFGEIRLKDNPNSLPSFIEWERSSDNQMGWVRICLNNKRYGNEEFFFESPNIVDLVFNAGWFEYKVAHILSGWDRAREICLNCHFPFRLGVDKNETDIIVNTGKKILFVECKTQITHTTDIDKFRSVVKAYGGTGSKALFVTDAKMSEVSRKKCEENGVLYFSLSEDHQGKNYNTALIELLEKEMFNINTK